jgi:hypothetical protein
MEPIITTLINFGIGGCMAALVVWHVWYTQTKQIPSLLSTFENQMSKEREAANQRLAQEREISHMRHEDNIKQSTLITVSLREVHHSLRNLGNQVSLNTAKIDLSLGLNGRIKSEVREQEGEREEAREHAREEAREHAREEAREHAHAGEDE